MHKLSSTQFEVALNLRLFQPQKRIPRGLKCNCSKDQKRIVDIQGIHFCSGCPYDGVRINSHDRVRDQVVKILKYSGSFTREESTSIFRGSNPDSNLRPDIVAYNLPSTNLPHVLDIQLTAPVPSNSGVLTPSQARTPLRAAKRAAINKIKKYEDIATANNLGFLPFIIEITGRLHPQAEALLKESIDRASDCRGIKAAILWKYWVSSLQIVMQRALADSIIVRAHKLVGGFQENADTYPVRLSDFNYMDRKIRVA
jgi:hypothetical protein